MRELLRTLLARVRQIVRRLFSLTVSVPTRAYNNYTATARREHGRRIAKPGFRENSGLLTR